MTRYQQELERLERENATLRARLTTQDGDIAHLQAKIRENELQIALLESERDFFKEQNNLNLADNRQLRDRLYKNPYSDETYNEA
jgi:hypothetical protein